MPALPASERASAVVLMAYGSPDRLEDVPAYYADIRGGRPITPEHLEDLVARYRRLGIEDSNPLNEITEATRAALEAELGIPVFTGMRHWRPRIADAVERRCAGGADELVGLVLAPHYSSMSIERYRAQLVDAVAGRAEIRFVERWGAEPGFVDLLAERVARHETRTSSSPPTRCRRGSWTRATRTRTSCSRRRGSSPSSAGVERVVVLVPERVADRRALARAGHPRPPGGARGGRRPRGARLPGRLRRRPPRDPLGHRRRGGRSARASSGSRLDRIELPNADPAFIQRARRARPASGRGTVHRREDRPDPGRRGLAPLPRPRERGAQPEGAVRPPRAHRGAGRAGARRRLARASSPGRPSGSSAATAPASRRCCA